MLEHIHIEGYKSFSTEKPLDIDLTPVSFLIGPNGAGKSCLVSFLDMLDVLLTEKWNNYVRSINSPSMFHRGPSYTKNIIASLTTDSDRFDFRLDYGELGSVVVDTLKSDRNRMSEFFSGISAYHFSDTTITSAMRRMSNRNQCSELYTNGGNLPAFLLRLREEHEDYYKLIRSYVQLAMPQFDDFLLSVNDAGNLWLDWNDKSSHRYPYTVSDFSDGTLRFIALATILLQPPKMLPRLIVLDEPELGLHPEAISLLANMIRQAAIHSQVVVATQSELLLDEADAAEVTIVENRESNGNYCSVAYKLDSEELSCWLENYSMGELWLKNVIGGNTR